MRLLIERLVIFADHFDQAFVDLVVESDERGGGLGLGRLDHFELAAFAHRQHAQRQRSGIAAAAAAREQQTRLDVLDRQREHRHNVVVIGAGFLHHDVELVADIEFLGIVFLELHVLRINVAKFFAALLDVLDDLVRRDQFGQILELEIDVEKTLRTLCIDERQEHAQEVVLQIEMNFGQQIVGNGLGLLERVHDLLIVGVVERIDDGVELLNELVEALDAEGFENLLNLLVGQAVESLDVADQGEQIELLGIDLLEKNGGIRLVDNLCHLVSLLK